MPRKPTDTIQVNLRIKEALRRRLEAAARKRDVSLNFEMVDRLTGSFDQAAHRTIDEAAARMEHIAVRFGDLAREAASPVLLWQHPPRPDLREAGEALLAQIEQLPTDAREKLKDAVEQMRAVLGSAGTTASNLAGKSD